MAGISALLLLASLLAAYYAAHLLFRSFLQKRPLPLGFRTSLKKSPPALLAASMDKIPVLGTFLEKQRERKRLEEFERGMPEVLRLMCIALGSGSSLVMALRYAAENCDEPLAGELKRTVWDLEAGQGFQEALESLRKRTHGSEFSFLTVAMEIQHQSGGSLSQILETLSGMLRQSAELKEELRTKTSQGKLSSRVVLIMPFALLAILSIFSPDYLANFLSSPLGLFLFFVALLLEALGLVLINRALAIDFSVDLEEGI